MERLPNRGYTPETDRTAEVIDLADYRKKKMAMQTLGIVTSDAKLSDEAAGFNSAETAAILPTEIAVATETVDTAEALKAATDFDDTDTSVGKELEKEVAATEVAVTSVLEDVGIKAGEQSGEIQDRVQERIIAEGVEQATTEETHPEELTDAQGANEVADAVATEMIVEELDSDTPVVGLTDKTKLELKSQMNGRTTATMTNEELAVIGASATHELDGEGVTVETRHIVMRDGSATSVLHTMEAARDTMRLINGGNKQFDKVTYGMGPGEKDFLHEKLWYMKQKYNTHDLSGVKMDPEDFLHLERAVARLKYPFVQGYSYETAA